MNSDQVAPGGAFAGTAEYYSRFRPPYPRSLFSDLLLRAEVPDGGLLLDLGCGPGRVAIPLMRRFRGIWAVDPEPEMLDEGKRLAGPASNISWIQSTAEDLIAPQGAFDLITAGESFHRFDQRLVGRKSIGWLRPGCRLALPYQVNFWPGELEWQKAARGVVKLYRNNPSPPEPSVRDKRFATFQEALPAIGFLDVCTHEFQSIHEWTVDSMIGYLYSTSILSPRALGDHRAAFEADFRKAMGRLDSNGRFPESIRFGYVLGTRP